MDSIQIMSFSGEKVGYPTQKNEALVARILRASSSQGDLVLDSFVGSGTTAVVAEKLGRRWIAADCSPVSIHATRKRLLAQRGVRPFVVQVAAARGKSPSGAGAKRYRVSARAQVTGRQVRIDLEALHLPKRSAADLARARVTHWSQWVDAWCVDWDHRDGVVNVDCYVGRTRPDAKLELSAAHTYEKAGTYVALVKVFDVLGGQAVAAVPVVVG
jgi:hypothetical protein